ncbi:MAG: SDR family NAD(P)-dependent oxidoreductase [Lentisphaerae bacterium]|nr:SDR family NAD(P)-dependent oxidoreductase [Lentisphaerota bacterium]
MTRTGKAWVLFMATRVCGLATDSATIALAYFSAFALRFDFVEPSWGWRRVAISFITVWAVHIASLMACGCYRLAWRRVKAADLPRYIGAMALACVVLTAMRFMMPSMALVHIRPPYSITVICFFLSTIGVLGTRFLWRVYCSSRQSDTELLERAERRFDNTVAARFLAGKTVMVTGAGGTIGSEITRQVAEAGAAKILMVERGENALYEIDREMKRGKTAAKMLPLMIDAGDRERMESVFREHHPEVVLHAAAYKHVPMVELNPDEGWRNNVEATRTLATLSKEHGVRRFVLISTDKAVNPVSVMGKTKREAEKIVISLNTSPNSHTSFCAVRFGNVFGSSGSVVPLFREQIRMGGPVTVTHPDMKRYFMTVAEAVSLVLQAASREERAIYTLDMGEPVKIVDLAEGMIEKAGFRPYVDIPIVFTGIRPGEKLFEEIDVSEKSAYRTDMAKIYITR